MRATCLTVLFFVTASLAFGQLDSGTITIQASRSANYTPDQISFNVSVTADPATSLDQVVASLANSGVTAANLSGLSGAQDVHSPLQWSFTLAVPFAKMKATVAALTALQQSIVQDSGGMTLAFGVQGIRYSTASIQSQTCAAKDLFADALAQAQALATAAGLAVGPVVAISDGSSVTASASIFYAPTFRIGDFYNSSWVSPTPSGCYLVITFSLLRYQ
jgi:uncharacterized protein YggE